MTKREIVFIHLKLMKYLHKKNFSCRELDISAKNKVKNNHEAMS